MNSRGSTSSTSSAGAAGTRVGLHRTPRRTGPARRAGGAAVSSMTRTSVHLRSKVVRQGRLHQGLLLGTLVTVCRVGQREVRSLIVDRHEPAAGVAGLGPCRQGLEYAVAPGLGQSVAVDPAARR